MTTRHRLVADIGGTNARLALLDPGGKPQQPVTYQCESMPGLVAAIRQFVSEQPVHVDIGVAAVAVATPVLGDRVKLTNSDWSFSIDEVKQTLELDRFEVVNDFTALALSVPELNNDETRQIGAGEAKADGAIAVIGPGTGLGVSALVPCAGHWVPLSGEGGHVMFSGSTERELAVHHRMSQRWPHVSAEHYLSGPGLVNMVTALREVDGLEAKHYSPSDVTRLGTSGEDASCAEVLEQFCRMLGTCAGNAVLTLGAQGGCYIGGGIVPRLGDYFDQSDFRSAFESNGRMRHYLESIPTRVIVAEYPALTGAATLLGR